MRKIKLTENATKQISKVLMKALVEPGVTTHDVLSRLDFWLDENNQLDCDNITITIPTPEKPSQEEG